MSKRNLRVVLSDICNYNCVFCSHDFNICRNLDIPLGFLEECVKVFASLGGKMIHYTGGEPLIFPHLLEIMKLSKSLGLKNALTTNGSMLPLQPEKFYSLVNSLNISVPSFIPEEYVQLTSSKYGLNDIIRNAIKAVRRGLHVKINTIYIQQNPATIKHIAETLSSHGIIIKLMNDMTADEEYYHKFLRFAENFRYDQRIEIESNRNPGLAMCMNCQIPHPNGCPSCSSVWIYPDGRITLCPFDHTESFLKSEHDSILKHIAELMKQN